MQTRGLRLRAAIGIALTWAFAWAVAASIFAHVPGFETDLPLGFLFTPLGFATGSIFAGILIATERHRPFDQMSLGRFAMWGFVSGLLLAGVITAAAAFRGENWRGEFRLFGPALTLASAVSAAGVLALARRTQRWRNLIVQLGAAA